MAETPEGKVKRWLYGSKQNPGRLFSHFPGAYVYKPPGGMFGVVGTPDCFLLWRGVFVAIEVKAKGNTPTAPQLRTLHDIRDQGGVAAVLTGKDEAKLALIKAEVVRRIRDDSPVQ